MEVEKDLEMNQMKMKLVLDVGENVVNEIVLHSLQKIFDYLGVLQAEMVFDYYLFDDIYHFLDVMMMVVVIVNEIGDDVMNSLDDMIAFDLNDVLVIFVKIL
jgi:hypothetical protein